MESEKFNINESMQQLGLYMIKDKTTGLHSFLYQSMSSEKDVCNEILNYFGSVFSTLKKAQKPKFLQSLHNSYIVKVGKVDIVSGLLLPDYIVLADLNDVVLKDKGEENNGKEKEVSDNVGRDS